MNVSTGDKKKFMCFKIHRSEGLLNFICRLSSRFALLYLDYELFDGFFESQEQQLKHLAFLNKKLNVTNVETTLREFMGKTKTGPSGMATRLSAIVQALNWMITKTTEQEEAKERRLKKILEEYQGLCHQFHSDGREQRMLLAESEQDFPVSPGHIQDLQDDKYTHEIMDNLPMKVMEGRPLNARQYLFYLRVLLVHITMANGQRAGPICNLTLQEAKAGLQKAKETGQQVASLRCHKHKTHTQRPARLNIKGKLRKYVEVWIERVRSKKATHNNLVCLRNGSPVDSTTHSNHCDRLGKSIGQRIPHANLSRKMNGQASTKLADKEKTDVA